MYARIEDTLDPIDSLADPALVAASAGHADNNAWVRQQALRWARCLINGQRPAAWADHTDRDIQFAITALDLRPGDRLLDLGCGWGRHSLPLASYGLDVTGLDLSHDLLTLAQHSAARHKLPVTWIEGDLASVPLSGPYDAVVQFCGNFLTWFADRDATAAVLARVAGWLRPGGRLLIGAANWQPDLPQRAQQWDEWDHGASIVRRRYDAHQRVAQTQTVIFGPDHARREYWRRRWWPSRDDMEAMFANAGLRVCRVGNDYDGWPYDPAAPGLIYVLARG